MIDLHSHIIPGIDDGPADLAGSLTMAEVAVAAGIETMVATPHIREDYPDVRPAELVGLVAELEAALGASGIPLRVVPGGELAISRAVDMSDADLREVTLGGNGTDLLVETPHGALPSLLEDVIGDLIRRGFRVTLAHPELSKGFQRDPDRLADLVGRGVLVQITASSLDAGRLSRKGQFTRRALRDGLVHVVASDSHAASWRPPDLSPALALGDNHARLLCEEIPAAILAGQNLPVR